MKNIIYLPSAIANYFIDNLKVDNLRLNKIVYISYGLSLAALDRRIFIEPIQAWRLGPVIPSIYHEFKSCGNDNITQKSTIYHPIDQKWLTPEIDNNDNDLKVILETVSDIYGEMPLFELVNRTHHKDTPWQKVFEEGKFHIEIKDSDIKNYYRKFIKKDVKK